MLDLEKEFISALTNDVTLNAIVPAKNIFVGPVDIVEEKSAGLFLPQINLWPLSESVRTVPFNARDSEIQVDIWTRKSQLELETIYERVLSILDLISTDEGGTHIFWQKLSSMSDQYEGDRRIWHRSARFTIWSQ